MRNEKVVAVGGTFDNFHLGHVQLLLKCFEISENVLIGVTSDALARNKNHFIESCDKRKRNLFSLLLFHKLHDRAKIITLNDPYGPTIFNEDISAIVVSEETLIRALEINNIRKGKHLNPLQIFVIPLVKDADLRPISSTKSRRDEKFCEKFLMYT
ncbi:MAG: pantetheine-phosphate adenylyltransferase [Candidatus Verstraetearchaeota archaeon]|jgi:pantetheine-phosphate adenylyltransferase|nr:pantetheine-phosphate adenylyltransferase [Candidatus Culexarchaeum yellowstonense]NHV11950.1 pantetheine-phosphate adenylyltransferase [Candidatus Verstraetearchaeota archaeon]